MESIDYRLKLLIFHPDDTFAHVAIINPQTCRTCDQGICLTVCPSNVFQWNLEDEAEPIIVKYKQCIECGACRLVCPHSNIHFQYPNGEFGVRFNDGVSLYPPPNNSSFQK